MSSTSVNPSGGTTDGETFGSGASVAARLADSDDTSGVSLDATESVTLTFGAHTIPVGAVLKSYSVVIRGDGYSPQSPQLTSFLQIGAESIVDATAANAMQKVGGTLNQWAALHRAAPEPNPQTSTLYLTRADSGGLGGLNLRKVRLDAVYVARPVVAIDALSTITNNDRPTISWVDTLDSDGGPQTFWWVRIFSGSSAPENPAAAIPVVEASGFDEASSWRPTEPLADGDYVACVMVSQTVNGNGHASAWDSEDFTLDVDRPGVPTISLVPNDELGQMEITVEASTGDATTTAFEAQRASGDEWIPVRTHRDDWRASGEGTQETVEAYPTVSHASVSNFTNPLNVGARDGNVATLTTSARVQNAYGYFGLDGLVPVGATIDKVEVIEAHYEGSGSDTGRAEVLAKKAGTGGSFINGPDGGATWFEDATMPTTLTEFVHDLTVPASGNTFTRSELLDGNFWVYLAGRNSSGNRDFAWDDMRVRITFTPSASGSIIQLKDDQAENADFTDLWGPWETGLVADSPGNYGDRHTIVTGNGETFTKLDGSPCSQKARRLKVHDGDNLDGERAEIGHNSLAGSHTGIVDSWAFWRYGEADYNITAFTFEIPSSGGPSRAPGTWQLISQFKNINSRRGTPPMSLHLENNEYQVWASDSNRHSDDSHEVWSCPSAAAGTQARFIWEVLWSSNPLIGGFRLTVEHDGGSTYDSGWITMATLKETDAGVPIKNTFRVGLYRNSTITGNAAIDVSNVQIGYRVAGSAPPTIVDYEAPSAEVVQYRVRAVHEFTDTGTESFSDWALAEDTLDSGYWLTHPFAPSQTREVTLRSFAGHDRPARNTVIQPLGRRDAVVITETRQAENGTVVFRGADDNMRDTLMALADARLPLLLKFPDDAHEPDRWVVLGDESVQRIVDHSWADERDVSYGWTKVARPDGALLE